jgi:hypothetical protein
VLYTADNAKLKINNEEILASNAAISLGANLSPNYLMTQRHTQSQVAGNGIGGTLTFSYYLTGKDYFKTFITGQGERPDRGASELTTQKMSGNFGGLNFESGFLTSYSVNFNQNSPAIANATVNFFDSVRGEFVATNAQAPKGTEVLNISKAVIESDFAAGVAEDGTSAPFQVDNFIAGTYNYNSEVQPVYLMDQTIPSDVSFGTKVVNMNFEIDNPTGYLPISGSDAKISVNLKNTAAQTVENFTCSGVINTRNLSSAAGDYIKQTINVTQNNLSAGDTFIAAIIDNLGSSGCVGIGTTGSEGNI